MTVTHLIPLLPSLLKPNVSLETARLNWLPLFDAVLNALESPGSLQIASLSDNASLELYLQLRPERYEQIERLTSKGKLCLSPWYVQPNEPILNNLEAVIRNLGLGLSIAATFGQKPASCLLTTKRLSPQLPQLLHGVGIQGLTLPSAKENLRQNIWRASDGTPITISSIFRSDDIFDQSANHIPIVYPLSSPTSITGIHEISRRPNTLQSNLDNYFSALSHEKNLPEWTPPLAPDFAETASVFKRLMTIEYTLAAAYLQHNFPLPHPAEILRYAWRQAFINAPSDIISALESITENQIGVTADVYPDLLAFNNPGFRLITLKQPADGSDGIIIRGENLTSQNQPLVITSPHPFIQARQVDLFEQPSGQTCLPDSNGAFRFRLTPNQIITLHLK
ncbi:MAG: hypothetical protein K8L97_29490 [Anaerolineae bacterium]|nr:hypothetical protein [Anaerolineae bacterium]